MNTVLLTGRTFYHAEQRQRRRDRPGYDISAAMSPAATVSVILFCSLLQERCDESAQPRRNSELPSENPKRKD